MGYKIYYTPENNEKYPLQTKQFPNGITAIICFGSILLLVLGVAHWGIDNMEEVLLPGNVSNLKQAAGQMVQSLQDGTPIGQAITAFCQEIIGRGIQAV